MATMGRPRNDARRSAIEAALRTKTRAEVAAEFGITLNTVRYYKSCARAESMYSPRHKGDEARCKCGLLLPCTCNGEGLHAVDYMRSGERPALAFSRMFRDS